MIKGRYAGSGYGQINATVQRVTQAAVLLCSEDGVVAWVPKSVFDPEDADKWEVGVIDEFNIREWFITKEFE